MSKTAKKSEPRERTASTEFSCDAPHAGVVYLAGTFNDWDPTAAPLTRRADGTWAISLNLPPGRYEYKFVVDGEWCCEPGCETAHQGCPKCVPNSFGTMNRVVEVPA
jgi:1,4-alpha-glucan branching enzyme